MTKSIENEILRVSNKYKVRGFLKDVQRSYRIGIGKIIVITFDNTLTEEIQQQLIKDLSYPVWFREDLVQAQSCEAVTGEEYR